MRDKNALMMIAAAMKIAVCVSSDTGDGVESVGVVGVVPEVVGFTRPAVKLPSDLSIA